MSPPSPGGGYSSGGVVAAASTSTATVTVTAATDSPDGSDSDYEVRWGVITGELVTHCELVMVTLARAALRSLARGARALVAPAD